jgi:hypothetical protein
LLASGGCTGWNKYEFLAGKRVSCPMKENVKGRFFPLPGRRGSFFAFMTFSQSSLMATPSVLRNFQIPMHPGNKTSHNSWG